MKKTPAKYLIAGLFLFLFWCPIIQDALHVFKGGELNGAYINPNNITFDFDNWFDGTYTKQKDEFLRYNFGFRADMIRIYNQCRFWLFKATSTEVYVGKENFLYEKQYIDSYYGSDFIGESAIQKRVALLKELQDTLKQRGIFLFVTFAPGKGSFYPEYFPDNLKREKGATNYERYSENCRASGVHVLDLKTYFLALKKSARYPLFPRCGMHWSNYGEFFAFDSILRYIGKETGKNMPVIRLDSIQLSTKPRFRDFDAGGAMNLITSLTNDTLAYPYYWVLDSGKAKLNFLNIGDSYYWEMYSYYSPFVFKSHEFWYYFASLWDSYNQVKKFEEVNLKEEILKQDVICLMYTDGSLGNFGSDFIEKALEQFKSGKGK